MGPVREEIELVLDDDADSTFASHDNVLLTVLRKLREGRHGLAARSRLESYLEDAARVQDYDGYGRRAATTRPRFNEYQEEATLTRGEDYEERSNAVSVSLTESASMH